MHEFWQCRVGVPDPIVFSRVSCISVSIYTHTHTHTHTHIKRGRERVTKTERVKAGDQNTWSVKVTM